MDMIRASQLMQIEKKCVGRDSCDRNCSACDLSQDRDELIEAYTTVIDAINHRIPQPLDRTKTKLICPTCHRHITNINCRRSGIEFCPKCGQSLDWSRMVLHKTDEYCPTTVTFILKFKE